MIEGSNFEKVIKIGFLNTIENDPQYNDKLNLYQKKFDLVLMARDDLSKINQILNEVFKCI